MSSVIEKHRLFKFKSFSLSHHRSAMKIGTDGVLLGAWAGDKALRPGYILDVGCGCGLISMMIAQRYEHSIITGIDMNWDGSHTYELSIGGEDSVAKTIYSTSGNVQHYQLNDY